MSMTPADYNAGIDSNAGEDTDFQSVPSSYDIVTYPADFTLDSIVERYKKDTIRMPGFQRNYVWSINQASCLIDSFLLGLPVPSIFLFTDSENEQLVIDGQQRLKTIVYFFDGYFGEPDNAKKKEFRLTGLNANSPYLGKTYRDLESTNKSAFNKLNNSVLRAFVVKQLEPKEKTSIYHIFARLNTGGTHLVGQEIRNCVYHGKFNDLLQALNSLDEWRLIFGTNKLHKRQRDVELILRFLALHSNWKGYKKPMKDFMSNFMALHQNADDKTLKEFQALFSKVCKLVLAELGEKPFHIFRSLNVAAYDSVFTAMSHALDKEHSNLAAKYKKLIDDADFIKNIKDGTTHEATIQSRIKLAKHYLTDN